MPEYFAPLTVWGAHDWRQGFSADYAAETLLIEWPQEEPSLTTYWLL